MILHLRFLRLGGTNARLYYLSAEIGLYYTTERGPKLLIRLELDHGTDQDGHAPTAV